VEAAERDRSIGSTCNWLFRQYLYGGGSPTDSDGEISMRWLIMLLIPLALAGCAVGTLKLPMMLGPSNTAPASCHHSGDTATYGDCNSPTALSSTQEAK
jgi:hypothetical protein